MKTDILLDHELKRTISQRANVDEYKICHHSSGTSTRPRPPWLEGCVKTDILLELKKDWNTEREQFHTHSVPNLDDSDIFIWNLYKVSTILSFICDLPPQTQSVDC